MTQINQYSTEILPLINEIRGDDYLDVDKLIDGDLGIYESQKMTYGTLLTQLETDNPSWVQNLSNSDLTIDSSGTRKLILGGSLSSDKFSVRNNADTSHYLEVRGNGLTIVKSATIAPNYSGSAGDLTIRPQNGLSPNNTGLSVLVANNTVGMKVSSNAVTDGLPVHIFHRILNTATGTEDSFYVQSDSGSGLTEHRAIHIDQSNTGATNVGLRLNVRSASNNYALDIVNGGIRIGGVAGFTGTGFYTNFTIQDGIITNAS